MNIINSIQRVYVSGATVDDLDRAAYDAVTSFVNGRTFVVERTTEINIFAGKLTANYTAYWEA